MTTNAHELEPKGMLVVAAIPAFNEERTIAKVVIRAQNHAERVIVCDDGSTDMTATIAEHVGADVVRSEKNMGKGEALRVLFKTARKLGADVMVTIDADTQHDPSDIPRLIKPIETGDSDVVIGSRFMGKTTTVPSHRKVDKVFLLVASIPVLLVAAALALDPSLVGTLEGFAVGGTGGNVTSDTPLSLLVAGYPFLRYVAVEITSDSSTIFLLLMAAVGVYASLKARKAIVLLPLLWLATIAIASPANEGAWRFSYVGLLPLSLLAAIGFDPLFQRLQRRSAVRRRKGIKPWRERRLFTTLVAIALLLLIVGGSWGTLLLYDSSTQGTAAGKAQRDVYISMQWLGKNTPGDSRLVSVTDWRYTFMGLLEGRAAAYSPLTTPDSLLAQLNTAKNLYVVLTALATVPGVTENPIPLYQNDTRFQLVYRNPDVLLFRVVSFGAVH